MPKTVLDKVIDNLKYKQNIYGKLIYDYKNYHFEPESAAEKKDLESNIKIPEMAKKQNLIQLIPEERQSVAADWSNSKTIEELNKKICTCLECPLGATRTNFVFGTGNPNAGIMVIGEAPGADEDAQGKPFVGRAGQLLTKILEAINFSRDEVFIANINKCRPPNNRRPTLEETEKCKPYLYKQIELIKPKFILALGLTCIDTLLGKSHKMAEMRGQVLDYQGVKLLVTYHPAALLRNPNLKKLVWEDVKMLRKMYDEAVAGEAL